MPHVFHAATIPRVGSMTGYQSVYSPANTACISTRQSTPVSDVRCPSVHMQDYTPHHAQTQGFQNALTAQDQWQGSMNGQTFVISPAWGPPTTAQMTRHANTVEMACMRPHTPSALNAQPIPAFLAPTKHHAWPRQILPVQHAQTHHWKEILHGLMGACSHVQKCFTTAPP